MPASSRALPAGCIFGLSFFEPMMIPTCGSSTSISSNASSTAGIVAAWVGSAGAVGSGEPVGWGSSEISLISFLSRLAGDPLDGAGGDVGTDLHSIEGDPAGGIVCAIARLRRARAEAGHIQYPPTGRDYLAVARDGAGVGHLGDRRRLGQAVDHVALGGALWIAGRGENDRHRPVVVELGGHPGKATRLAGGEEELGEVGAQPRQHRLGLGVTE